MSEAVSRDWVVAVNAKATRTRDIQRYKRPYAIRAESGTEVGNISEVYRRAESRHFVRDKEL